MPRNTLNDSHIHLAIRDAVDNVGADDIAEVTVTVERPHLPDNAVT